MRGRSPHSERTVALSEVLTLGVGVSVCEPVPEPCNRNSREDGRGRTPRIAHRHHSPRPQPAVSNVCEPRARQAMHDACAAPRCLRTVMLLLAVWVGDAVWEYCNTAPNATLRSTCGQPAADSARIDDGTPADARSPAAQSMSLPQLPISLRVLTDTLTELVGVAEPEPCKTRQTREHAIQYQRGRGTYGDGRAGLQGPKSKTCTSNRVVQ